MFLNLNIAMFLLRVLCQLQGTLGVVELSYTNICKPAVANPS